MNHSFSNDLGEYVTRIPHNLEDISKQISKLSSFVTGLKNKYQRVNQMNIERKINIYFLPDLPIFGNSLHANFPFMEDTQPSVARQRLDFQMQSLKTERVLNLHVIRCEQRHS